MTTTLSVRREAEKVSPPCPHCARGWVYDEDPDTGDELAFGCWMCPEGKAIEKAGAR